MKNEFIDIIIKGYKITKPIGQGQIGKVYLAYNEDIDEYRAIKFIQTENLRVGWLNEIKKVIKLKTTDHIVKYHDHGSINIGSQEYLYIFWEFIPGKSLKEIIKLNELTFPILKNTVDIVLEVLHACRMVQIDHADLHCGNVLVQDNNELSINPEHRKIWITDFGYATADTKKEYLDDYKGLLRIIEECLRVINPHELEGEDRELYQYLKRDLPKILLENNETEGDYVRNPKKILERWKILCDGKHKNLVSTSNIGDYLAAESIGDRFDEWKKLFVPKFLAIDELLSKNICVLTGLRGCGKTMIFRRLTALYDAHLGPSGFPDSNNFIGFYLNARNIAEAFPWLPSRIEEDARCQVINFFHLSWLLEILDWLKVKIKNTPTLDINWLSNFFFFYYPSAIITSKVNIDIIDHLYAYINKELDKSRLYSRYNSSRDWVLSDITFLDKLAKEIIDNCQFGDTPLYFFLDDYSTPLVTSSTQKILNPIVFRRSPIVFFKIATESSESFEPIGLNGKILEEEDDYLLIDIGSYAFQIKDPKEIIEILSDILKPRIERHHLLASKNLTLEKILGETILNNTELALLLRDPQSKVTYKGIDVFCLMWSSDIRESISLFAEMISKVNDTKLAEVNFVIDDNTQDTAFREAGGKFLSLLEAANAPSLHSDILDNDKPFGAHLVEIVKAFHEIAIYDLKNTDSKNQKRNPPKQARRIEIRSCDKLPDKLYEYYKGLIRYGVFIRDHRGKSVRGQAVPRLYLRGLLIPFFTLSFSKRDSISLNWEEFCQFLEKPSDFAKKFIKNRQVYEDPSPKLWQDEK